MAQAGASAYVSLEDYVEAEVGAAAETPKHDEKHGVEVDSIYAH